MELLDSKGGLFISQAQAERVGLTICRTEPNILSISNDTRLLSIKQYLHQWSIYGLHSPE